MPLQAKAILYQALAWVGGSFQRVRDGTAPLLMPLRNFILERIIIIR